jgi:poly-beta-hydroxyalkanoate depolymerase
VIGATVDETGLIRKIWRLPNVKCHEALRLNAKLGSTIWESQEISMAAEEQYVAIVYSDANPLIPALLSLPLSWPYDAILRQIWQTLLRVLYSPKIYITNWINRIIALIR